MELVPEAHGRRLVKWYRCSNCWRALVAHSRDGGTEVLCGNCGEETNGYVTAKYVDRRRAQSVSDAHDVTRMLIKFGYLPDPLAGKTQEQKLKELGF
jgi:DNA-directed RNA polymerase subunit RPC12/RpoP